jgi:hypothetical protein
MTNTKPFVSAAFVCERVLQEKDGTTSAIRIIDNFYIPASIAPDTSMPVTVFIGLKSDVPREGIITVIVNTPDGKKNELPDKWPISFSSAVTGANLILTFGLFVRHVGTTWIDVVYDGEMLTRTPIRLVRGDKPETSQLEKLN